MTSAIGYPFLQPCDGPIGRLLPHGIVLDIAYHRKEHDNLDRRNFATAEYDVSSQGARPDCSLGASRTLSTTARQRHASTSALA